MANSKITVFPEPVGADTTMDLSKNQIIRSLAIFKGNKNKNNSYYNIILRTVSG